MNKPNKGLGKGISALFSENSLNAPAANESGSGVEELAVGQLTAGRFQPRRQFTRENLDELAASIRSNGIMQPIVARKIGDGYEIIAGERRWRAAKQAGLATVPVIIRELTDKQALELAIIENVQRQDLSALEEAQGYQRLMQEFQHTQDDVAKIVGKSRSHVANLLRLLSLPDTVKQFIDSGQLTMGQARPLVGNPLAEEIAERVVIEGLNARQVETLVKELSTKPTANNAKIKPADGNNKPAARQTSPSDIKSLQDALNRILALPVDIQDKGGKGQIVISYKNVAELDQIMERLGA